MYLMNTSMRIKYTSSESYSICSNQYIDMYTEYIDMYHRRLLPVCGVGKWGGLDMYLIHLEQASLSCCPAFSFRLAHMRIHTRTHTHIHTHMKILGWQVYVMTAMPDWSLVVNREGGRCVKYILYQIYLIHPYMHISCIRYRHIHTSISRCDGRCVKYILYQTFVIHLYIHISCSKYRYIHRCIFRCDGRCVRCILYDIYLIFRSIQYIYIFILIVSDVAIFDTCIFRYLHQIQMYLISRCIRLHFLKKRCVRRIHVQCRYI